jgi:hypothetical protein
MAISLPSTLGVGQVVQLREVLLKALEAERDLELDARGVEEVDVAGLQLVEAASRSAVGRGGVIRFVPGGRGALETVALGAGLRLTEDPLLWREIDHGS